MDDLTTKLAEALRLISFASMDRGARDAATEALRLYDAAKAQPKQAAEPAILNCEIQPRPLSHPLTDYRHAISEGPLHYTWQDKPHRLVYDLIAAVRFYAAPVAQAEPVAGVLATRLAVAEEMAAHYAAQLDEVREQKDGAYLERNRCVALIARMALALGLKAGVAKTAIEGWSEDWHGCVYIDLPEGQASWHYHDSQAFLFDGLPTYAGAWDGHSTPEKYERVAASFAAPVAQAEPEWLPIDGGYFVSSDGLVKDSKGGLLGQWKNQDGYMLVRLNNPRRIERVHRLVAKAFVPNPGAHSVVNHLDSDRANNRAVNLEWCTQAENLAHATSMGRMQRDYWKGKRSPNAFLTDGEVRAIRAEYATGSSSLSKLAEKFGISKRCVGRVVNLEVYRDVQ